MLTIVLVHILSRSKGACPRTAGEVAPPAASTGAEERLPGPPRQRLRRLAGIRQSLLAGAVLRRRRGPDQASPFRRRRLRAIRDGDPAPPRRGGRRRPTRRTGRH